MIIIGSFSDRDGKRCTRIEHFVIKGDQNSSVRPDYTDAVTTYCCLQHTAWPLQEKQRQDF